MKAFIFVLTVLSTSMASANAVQALLETTSRVAAPFMGTVSLCSGMREGMQPSYRCGALTSDAQIEMRAICDGTFGGMQRSHICDSIRYRDTQKAQEKMARDLCQGLYWGRAQGNNCEQLAGPKETDPAKLVAKDICFGVDVGIKSWESCASLKSDRARKLCDDLRRWTPTNALCRL